MADAGVHDLKKHLSEYLDRVERGELVAPRPFSAGSPGTAAWMKRPPRAG